MTEKLPIPQTAEEAGLALADAFGSCLTDDSWLCVGVRVTAWLNAAEPRLRPKSETPQVGDWVARLSSFSFSADHFVATMWTPKHYFESANIGWVLIRRAPKSLREMAFDLGTLPSLPSDDDWSSSRLRQWCADAEELRLAVLAQEPRT